MSDFIFLGFKINVDNDYNHRIKRHLLLERGAVTNLRQRHHFANKVRIVKAMAFPIVTYGCERVGPLRRLSAKELTLLNSGAGENS